MWKRIRDWCIIWYILWELQVSMWHTWNTVHWTKISCIPLIILNGKVRKHQAYLDEAATKCWNECMYSLLPPTSSLHSHKQPIKHLPKAPTNRTSGLPRTTAPPFRGWFGKRATHVTLYMPSSHTHTHTHLMASMDIWGAFVKAKKKNWHLWLYWSGYEPDHQISFQVLLSHNVAPHRDAWEHRTVKLVWMEN